MEERPQKRFKLAITLSSSPALFSPRMDESPEEDAMDIDESPRPSLKKK